MVSALEDYLNYYKKCESPGYAVLVTGAWGTGKTYQVKQALGDGERYYISLFGLHAATDVYSEVFLTMAPNRQWIKKHLYSASQTIKGIGGKLSVLSTLPSLLNAAIRHKVKTDRILVFDDLERCQMSAKEIMGVINTYVEHHKCRVVIIANDEKLDEKKDTFKHQFVEGKEKIIGQTIRVKPQTEVAFDKFCNALKGPSRTFVSGYKNEIIGIFKASDVQSLRTLRHVIEDLVRLYDCLDDTHRNHEVAMTKLVGLCATLNIEIRNNSLEKNDLQNLENILLAYEMEKMSKGDEAQKPPLLVANSKYPTIDLDSAWLLPDHILIQMFFDGLYDQKAIQDALNNHHYFLKPDDVPPWKTIINFAELDDDVVNIALGKMDKQIEEHEIIDSAEMLAIFSLRMMLAEKKIIESTVKKEVVAAKKYIDDLLKEKRLPPRELDRDWKHNTGSWSDERPEFQEIKRYLFAAREKAIECGFPKIIESLLRLMKTDSLAFKEQVCQTNNGPNPYAFFPILHHIPTQTFVDTWLNSPKDNWRWIASALRVRYRDINLLDDLKCEKSWMKEVINLLESAVKDADGFQALRIERTIPKTLKDLVDPREKKKKT